MAGLRKAKQYDWKDSNLALFGSDTERNVKKESACQEPAWKKAGQKPGLQIWRIVQFKVTTWPVQDYGKFYNGDSYIILNTYKEEGTEQLLYDVHFWIGQYSSQDEYGTAAYKTVELDTFLDDVPIQHREVQDNESELFLSYFKNITIMEGGADSGFTHVKPTEYIARLFHVHGDRTSMTVKEIPKARSKLDINDVYILDNGLMLYQWNGSGANKDEKRKAMHYLKGLQQERGGKCQTDTIDEGCSGEDDEFYNLLTDDSSEVEEGQMYQAANKTKELYRLSDASGKMEMKKEAEGTVKMSHLDTKDVFILDTKKEVFVWIGKKTSANEKKNAMTYAHNYLMKSDHPLVPISCLPEGRRSKAFTAAIAA